jgi:hypothetical protein
VLDWLGWVATAVFAVSYFCKRPVALRGTQAVAALLWLGYGIIIKAPPVIVANIIVALMAAVSAWREHRRAQLAFRAASRESEPQEQTSWKPQSSLATEGESS